MGVVRGRGTTDSVAGEGAEVAEGSEMPQYQGEGGSICWMRVADSKGSEVQIGLDDCLIRLGKRSELYNLKNRQSYCMGNDASKQRRRGGMRMGMGRHNETTPSVGDGSSLILGS